MRNGAEPLVRVRVRVRVRDRVRRPACATEPSRWGDVAKRSISTVVVLVLGRK